VDAANNRMDDDAVDADKREDESQGSEPGEDKQAEAARSGGFADDVIHGLDFGDGQLRIDGPNGGAQCGSRAGGNVRGPQGDIEGRNRVLQEGFVSVRRGLKSKLDCLTSPTTPTTVSQESLEPSVPHFRRLPMGSWSGQ
jgi:hypothetical protein